MVVLRVTTDLILTWGAFWRQLLYKVTAARHCQSIHILEL